MQYPGRKALLACKLSQLLLVDLQGRQLLPEGVQGSANIVCFHSLSILLLQDQELRLHGMNTIIRLAWYALPVSE
jgi:hypothetical protein